MNDVDNTPARPSGGDDPLLESCTRVLARHSSTFEFAARLLPSRTRDDATVLYALCRTIDDIADEAADCDRARRQLRRIRMEVEQRRAPRPIVGLFFEVASRRGFGFEPLLELIDGVESDLGRVRIKTDEQLLRYCYRVAGTVGLMMCSVLGVDDERATPHAIDLGVAMQLTNICRDVVEDAGRNRVYLPARRLSKAGLSPAKIVDGDFEVGDLATVIDDVLRLADDYYRSADAGMWAIPTRARYAIAVASRIYRSIGVRLRRRGCDVTAGPDEMSRLEMAYWLGASTAVWVRKTGLLARRVPHRRQLHRPLYGLFGGSA